MKFKLNDSENMRRGSLFDIANEILLYIVEWYYSRAYIYKTTDDNYPTVVITNERGSGDILRISHYGFSLSIAFLLRAEAEERLEMFGVEDFENINELTLISPYERYLETNHNSMLNCV